MESDFSRVPLTPNFFEFREEVKNPPVKQFDPPRINGRKVPLRNGAGPGTGPPSDDSGKREPKRPKEKKGKTEPTTVNIENRWPG